MSAPHAQQIVNGYLAQLELELDTLTAPEKSDVLAQIEGHIRDARSALTDETDADLLNIIDRLGSPEEVAAESVRNRPSEGPIPVARRRAATVLERLMIAAAILAWAGGLASLIGALLLVSDFGSAAFISLFAGICGVTAGIVVFRRPAVTVVGVLIASLAEGINLYRLTSLPLTVTTLANAALVLLIASGALAGVATVLRRSQLEPRS
jgi:uncharacterized membrane protein